MKKLTLTGIISIIAMTLSSTNTTTASPKEQSLPADECIRQLEDETVERIGCTIFFEIDDEQKADLKTLTAGVLLGAQCMVAVDIARQVLFESLLNSTRLVIPPQPTACEISTNNNPLHTDFTLAPQIEFNNGRAVAATPGLADIGGMPPILAKILQDWVNSSMEIETAIVDSVNQYIDSKQAVNKRAIPGKSG